MRTLMVLCALTTFSWWIAVPDSTHFADEAKAQSYQSKEGCTHSLRGIRNGRHDILRINHWGQGCTYVTLKNGKSFKIPRNVESFKHRRGGKPNTAIVNEGRVELARLNNH